MKQKVKTVQEDKKTLPKQRIRELIKRPKEKFLTKNQEEYWKILGENQITLCFGPAGVGKSYIAMKRAVDLLWDDSNKYEKIIIVRLILFEVGEMLAERLFPDKSTQVPGVAGL